MVIGAEEIITELYGQKGPRDLVLEVFGLGSEGALPDFSSEMIDFHHRTKGRRPQVGRPYVAECVLRGVDSAEATDAFFVGVGRLDKQIEKRSPLAFNPERLALMVEHENDHLKVIRVEGLGERFDLALMRVVRCDNVAPTAMGTFVRYKFFSGFTIAPCPGANIPPEADLRMVLAPKEPSPGDIGRAELIIPVLFKSPDDPKLRRQDMVKLERKLVKHGGKPFNELIPPLKTDLIRVKSSSMKHPEDVFDMVLSEKTIIKSLPEKEKIT